MIVPDHWAESSKKYKASGKQITVHRYGWSNTSEADAQFNAHARVEDALLRILSGEKLSKREPKVAYNGADGVPIREEVLARHDEQVITRNAYGARCLNSPNALFADIDFDEERTARSTRLTFALLFLASIVSGGLLRSWPVTITLLIASLVMSAPLANVACRLSLRARGGSEHIARTRLLAFLAQNPSWNVRLYRTPAGLRLMATHQQFDATADEVKSFFTAVSTDPVYMQMCSNQRCFRARLSAKPWRIGIPTHMRPRPGVWPVRPAQVPIRREWIAKYEKAAAGFSACRYIESLGSGIVEPAIKTVIELHDQESGALIVDAPLA